jgi:hypothetical protein
MKAFHGDPAIKEKYLARLKAHHAADEIIQGVGYEGTHGCAVGCTLNAYDHRAYENELGLPKWLAHLEDQIFEGLPPVEAQRFAVDFLEAVPVSANVEKVRWLLAVRRHTRDRDRLMENPESYAKECVVAIDQVIAYCESQIAGSATESAASAAAAESAASAAAARSAAAAESAWSAWSAAAESAAAESAAAESAAAESAAAESAAAESAAWSAWSAARSAARSARSAAESARSAAESAAESDHFKWEAETLLELLRNAPQAAE